MTLRTQMALLIFCAVMATVLGSFFMVHVLQVMRNQVSPQVFGRYSLSLRFKPFARCRHHMKAGPTAPRRQLMKICRTSLNLPATKKLLWKRLPAPVVLAYVNGLSVRDPRPKLTTATLLKAMRLTISRTMIRTTTALRVGLD